MNSSASDAAAAPEQRPAPRRRRVLGLGGSALLAGAVLTACGGKQDPQPASSSSASATVSPVPTQAPSSPQSVEQRIVQALDAVCQEHGSALGLAVLDHRTGTRYEYHADQRTYEASVVKVPIALTAMRLAKEQGGALSDVQKDELTHSIEESDNEATQQVFVGIGDSVRSHDAEVNGQQPGTPDPSMLAVGSDPDAARALNDTYAKLSVAGTRSSGSWGDNETSAPDQMQIAYALVQGIDWVDAGDLDTLRGWMDPQDPSQTWGVGSMKGQSVAGQGVTGVGVKNGWLPDDSQKWSVNSTGWVKTADRTFSIGLVSSGFADEQTGMDAATETVQTYFRTAFGG